MRDIGIVLGEGGRGRERKEKVRLFLFLLLLRLGGISLGHMSLGVLALTRLPYPGSRSWWKFCLLPSSLQFKNHNEFLLLLNLV